MVTMGAIKGVIRNGKVEVAEGIDAPEGTEVIVSVPVERQQPAGARDITFGGFAKEGGRESTWEHFQEAKQFWERSWDRLEKE